MSPRISIRKGLPSVHPSVALSSKTRQINNLCISGSLLNLVVDQSSHLHKVCLHSVGLSVFLSRYHYEYEYKSTNQSERTLRNHAIIPSSMRTHRWPYGPCFLWRLFYEDNDYETRTDIQGNCSSWIKYIYITAIKPLEWRRVRRLPLPTKTMTPQLAEFQCLYPSLIAVRAVSALIVHCSTSLPRHDKNDNYSNILPATEN